MVQSGLEFLPPSVLTVCANGFDDLIKRQPLLPLLAVAGVVTSSGAVQAQEPGEAIGAEFTLQEFQGVAFKLLVRQLVDGVQRFCSLVQGYRIPHWDSRVA